MWAASAAAGRGGGEQATGGGRVRQFEVQVRCRKRGRELLAPRGDEGGG